MNNRQLRYIQSNYKLLFVLLPLLLVAGCGTSGTGSDAAWPSVEAGAEAAGFSATGIQELDSAMEKIVSDGDVAGMVWLLAKDGKLATYEASGYASLEDQIPMQNDSLFRIYSMTKPITGVAMMILYEYGYWDFDDPVGKHVPELANLKVMTGVDEQGNAIVEPMHRQPTMRELMNHSAGFGYGLFGNDPANTAFRDKGVLISKDLNELIDKVKDIPLIYQPGEQWAYSIAVDIQGYIVEKMSGEKLGDFLEKHIFIPLGMKDTRFYIREQDVDRVAQVYGWDREQNKLVRNPPRTDRPSFYDPNRLQSGGGGLVSTTHDYARFLQMLVNGGELDGQRILTEESVKIMRTNSLADGLYAGFGREEDRVGQGFGVDFAVIMDPQAQETPQSVGTYHWSGAAGTWFWIDPVEDMFFIGMIQSRGGRRPDAADMRGIANEIIYDSLVE